MTDEACGELVWRFGVGCVGGGVVESVTSQPATWRSHIEDEEVT